MQKIQDEIAKVNKCIGEYITCEGTDPVSMLAGGLDTAAERSSKPNAKALKKLEAAMHEYIHQRTLQNMADFTVQTLHNGKKERDSFEDRKKQFAETSKAAMEKFKTLFEQFKEATNLITEYERKYDKTIDGINMLK